MDKQARLRLTSLSVCAGCAAKIGPADLAQVLRGIAQEADPNLLVGFDLSDDAGVYRLTDDLALVQTVDIFTAIVDDPYTYGQIAAANALSDIYAMGGRPVTALAFVGFPRAVLPFEVMSEILRGGVSKVQEAGATVVGGHSVENSEPLYGLAVTGLIHPDCIATNAGARPGDVLVLTKPLGTGIVTTAIKRDACPDDVARAAITSMTTLNRAACEAMVAVGIGESVHACTDVTGFGLLGHAAEMARASQVALRLQVAQVPWLPGVVELAVEGRFATGGGARNAAHAEGFVQWPEALSMPVRDLLTDPQTSGGLLMTVAADHVNELLRELQSRGVIGHNIGTVHDGSPAIRLLS